MSNPGSDTVTFRSVTAGAKSARGIAEPVETDTPVSGCSFQPLTGHFKLTDDTYADATHRCISPPKAAVLACKAGDFLVFDGATHFVVVAKRHWDRGRIDHVTVICREQH